MVRLPDDYRKCNNEFSQVVEKGGTTGVISTTEDVDGGIHTLFVEYDNALGSSSVSVFYLIAND